MVGPVVMTAVVGSEGLPDRPFLRLNPKAFLGLLKVVFTISMSFELVYEPSGT